MKRIKFLPGDNRCPACSGRMRLLALGRGLVGRDCSECPLKILYRIIPEHEPSPASRDRDGRRERPKVRVSIYQREPEFSE